MFSSESLKLEGRNVLPPRETTAGKQVTSPSPRAQWGTNSHSDGVNYLTLVNGSLSINSPQRRSSILLASFGWRGCVFVRSSPRFFFAIAFRPSFVRRSSWHGPSFHQKCGLFAVQRVVHGFFKHPPSDHAAPTVAGLAAHGSDHTAGILRVARRIQL